jgi:hypothetical protein
MQVNPLRDRSSGGDAFRVLAETNAYKAGPRLNSAAGKGIALLAKHDAATKARAETLSMGVPDVPAMD